MNIAAAQTGSASPRRVRHRQTARRMATSQLQMRIDSLREQEALLQEELRQLRAAVAVYQKVVNTLAARAASAERTASAAY